MRKVAVIVLALFLGGCAAVLPTMAAIGINVFETRDDIKTTTLKSCETLSEETTQNSCKKKALEAFNKCDLLNGENELVEAEAKDNCYKKTREQHAIKNKKE